MTSPSAPKGSPPGDAALGPLQKAIVALDTMKAKLAALEREKSEPIAIIGMACRFPGGANSPEAFHDLLLNGHDAVTAVPTERWSVDAHARATHMEELHRKASRWGAFIQGDPSLFDAAFFEISPREAAHMDPQQRLLLEVGWETLERAGLNPLHLVGTNTGVFLGLMNSDYAQLCAEAGIEDIYAATGNGHCFPAGRLAFAFGLQGPAVTVDTACSSSLVAIHLACQSIRSGESSLALAGGVNLMLSPATTRITAATNGLSPDGRCKTFDAAANGFVRGEGCGIVLLKRLSDARRDGDAIVAIVRSSAVNQDGRSTGMTTPNVLSQQALLRRALGQARISAEDIGYVEMHGTGTPLGDPIEAEALRAVFGRPRADVSKCILGAVKTNIGHLEAAAGIAGMIKAVLALKHETIPGNIHFRALNPRISLEDTPFLFPTEHVPWGRSTKPRRAGVSSFGMSGTNAHVILEEAPPESSDPPTRAVSSYFLPLSAKTADALAARAQSYAAWLSNANHVLLEDVVFTASVRRMHHEHRLAAVARTREEFAEMLRSFARGETPGGVVQGQAKSGQATRIAFVFSGQGSQWAGMGKSLLDEEPVFRAKLEEISALMRNYATFSLLDELCAPEETSRLRETEIAQPALFALHVGLTALFRSWGVEPDSVLGHSIGEVAAAHVSGALSLEDAVRLVVLRGRIMQKATGGGKMVWVALPADEALRAIAGLENAISIAAINDPSSVVLSGETAPLDALVSDLEKRGIVTRPLRVNYAFHSPQMAPLAQELIVSLDQLVANDTTIGLYSTVTGARIDGQAMTPKYWGRNVRECVSLAAAVQAALGDGHRFIVEVGPHPVLLSNLEQCARAHDINARAICTLRRNDGGRRSVLEAVGAMHVEGVNLDWKKLYPDGGRIVPSPTYPWQRERYWIETSGSHVERAATSDPLDESLYVVQWRPAPLPHAKATAQSSRPGAWLVFMDASGIGLDVCARLTSSGDTCIRVEQGAAYERLNAHHYRIDISKAADYQAVLDAAYGNHENFRGVIDLFGLDAPSWNRMNLETLRDSQTHGVVSAIYLVQALLRKNRRDQPRLWVVTRGAIAIQEGVPAVAAAQTPLWGFGRTVAVEYPELDCRCVDLSPEPDFDAAPILAHELITCDEDDQIALHQNGRFVARLARARLQDATRKPVALRADATYLITGGLGGLGLSVAQSMVADGARHIALVGRRDPPESVQATIRTMEAAGATIYVLQCDVSQFGDLAKTLDTLRERAPELRGIVHTAGIVDDRTLLEMSEEQVRRVLAPKVDGAWNLHTLTQHQTLDFYVMYSSVASLFGSPGQANYAAANAFLDGLAHARAAEGLAAMSIHWGPFTEVGMAAANDKRGTRVALRGMQGLSAAEGYQALMRLLEYPRAEIAVMRLNVRQWIDFFPQLAARPFWTELASEGIRHADTEKTRDSFRVALEKLPKHDQRRALEKHLREQLGRTLQLEPNRIESMVAFRALGIDSLMSLEVRNRLETSLGLKLPATLLFTYPHLDSLTEFLWKECGLSETTESIPVAVTALQQVDGRDEPIAIIGQACRFPGGGSNPERFWRALVEGVDAIREATPARWPKERIPPDHPGAGYAALLDGLDLFDAGFFGISPREAEALDPQQRMLLEVTWEALENAGEPPDRLIGSKTGIFVGITTLDYQRIVMSLPEHLDAYGATGTMLSTAAGRLSYVLGLQGPAVALDTACSSSLVAIHLACQSLRARESSLAVAGGANALLSWENMITLSTMRALSSDGRCKTLDAHANGYVRGEGCGMIVMKRHSDAQRNGDRILALIRGSAINQDGRSTGLTAPNVLAQQALLVQALENAHLHPEDIGYIEMHGTGTPLGDPIEANALRHVLGKKRVDESKCFLGAVKTNIGHLESAAGIAGVIKALQILQHEVVPGNLHFRTLNPRISFDGTPFVVPTGPLPWPRGSKPRRAGISSFGMSGTNAHIIVEEVPAEPTRQPVKESLAYLVPLSAKTPQALTALAHSYAEWFSQPNDALLHDVTYTTSLRRTHHAHRLALVARTREEFAEMLQSFARGGAPAGAVQGRPSPQGAPRVVFVFPGQGSQWLGMGRQLLTEEPIFRKALEACEIPVQREAGFSILEQVAADETHSRLHEIDVIQPLLFSLQVALATLWRSWGIEPDCVVGHSMGEVAAAYIAGMFSLEDAAKIICRRSHLLKRISGQGAMALVELPMAEAEAAIAGYETQLSVAVSNGPRSTVLSGDPAALEQLIANLEKNGVFCRRVKVDVASHSPQVDQLLSELLGTLADVHPAPAKLQMQSTVTGHILQGHEVVASYWANNLRQPVCFSQVIQDLIRSGHPLFVEMSPHPILLPSIEENLECLHVEGAAIASMRRQTDERRTMLEALGTLHTRGCNVDWKNLYPDGGRVVSLPTYPWQRERYWIDAPKQRPRLAHSDGGHPLLGVGFVLASQPQLHVWEQWLSVDAFPYLADHRVQGEIVFPGAGYVEMALAAAKSVYGEGVGRLEHIAIEQMLALAQDEVRLVQVSLTEDAGGRGTITISSKRENAKDWIRHASGTVLVSSTPSASPPAKSRRDIQLRCPTLIENRQHYEQMEARGLSYGPTFRGVAEVRIGANEIIARVHVPDELRHDTAGYLVHPTLLDACFQATLWTLQSTREHETFVPVHVDALRMYEQLPTDVWVHAQIAQGIREETPVVAISVHDESGRVLFEVGELHVRALDSVKSKTNDPFANCIFHVAWRKSDFAAAPAKEAQPSRHWLVLLDSSGLGSTLVEQLRARGDRVVAVAAHQEYGHLGENAYRLNPTDLAQWEKLLAAAFGKTGCQGVIDCLPLDGSTFYGTTETTLASDIQRGIYSALRLVQAILKQGWRNVPRFYTLTRGAQAVEGYTTALSISQSMLWGLGRVIAMEQPDIGCVRIDLPLEPGSEEPAFILQELAANTEENQIAYRSGQRYVARLARGQWDTDGSANEGLEPAAGRPYRMSIREPGVFERLVLRPMERRMPGPGEVEIEIEAAGLNFLDVLLTLGVLPDDVAKQPTQGPRLGGECAGRIVGIGEGVSDVEIGEEVIALAPSAMATHAIAERKLVVAKPPHLNWTEAATVPIVFSTAYHALAHVARLQKDERILIHAGAGGVGMAAIQWAQHVGAEIFATAGSEEKRAFLRALGVHHVMDSRSMSFVDDVRRITRGEGVDVVLNSLSGKLLDASFDLLRDHGRFIEIGKRDYYENRPLGLRPFLKNLSFSLVDLRGMMMHRPDAVASLLHQVMNLFAAGIFKPLPCTVFSIANAAEAFNRMAQGKHTGKLALTIPKDEPRIAVPVTSGFHVRSDDTYLIIGGLGGLGLSLAGWMVQQGARHLVLIGRSAPNAAAESAITDMRAAGATVHTMQANVARRAEVDAVISRIATNMPPLRGIVHAAAVLADRMLPNMSEDEFFTAIEPKVFGAWNLHEATRNLPLDFFVMYSSAAGLLGSPGQANYAAANTFLDALSHARVAEGLPATSIQWGPFADVGLAAASDIRANRIASRGGDGFKSAEGNELFGRVMASPRPEVGLMRFDVRQWVEFYPQMAGAPFVTELFHEGDQPKAPQAGVFRDELERVGPAQRLGCIETHLLEQLGKVLRLDPQRIDKLTPFTSLGMDSLMSLELRNRLEASLQVKLSAALLFTYATTASLAAFILDKLGYGKTSVSDSMPSQQGSPPELTEESADATADDDLLAAFDASAARVRKENLS